MLLFNRNILVGLMIAIFSLNISCSGEEKKDTINESFKSESSKNDSILVEELKEEARVFEKVNKNIDYDYSEYYNYLTPEYLKSYNPNYIYFSSFEEAFPKIKHKFNLTPEENKIVGRWEGLGEIIDDINMYKETYRPVFYPNKLLLIKCSIKLNPDEKDRLKRKYLSFFYGTWSIDGSMVKGKIKGVGVELGKTGYYGKYIYSFINLTNELNVDLIDLNDIHPQSYTLKPFRAIMMPEEVYSLKIFDNLPEVKEEIKKSGMDKEISERLRIFKDSLAYKIYYGLPVVGGEGPIDNYFEYIEEMQDKGITGEMIVDEPERYRKYLELYNIIFGLSDL